jgi:hypothetical protein
VFSSPDYLVEVQKSRLDILVSQFKTRRKKMNIIFSGKRILILAATALLGTFSIIAQTSSDQKTLTGVVSDAMCGQTHMMKDKSAAECTRYCAKQGNKYALVVGKTVYTLGGHEANLDKYAGQKVTVTGTVKGETVTVETVVPVK